MSLTVVKGLQSEIFVPVTPPPVWAPVKKELKDMTIALATAAGVHHIAFAFMFEAKACLPWCILTVFIAKLLSVVLNDI